MNTEAMTLGLRFIVPHYESDKFGNSVMDLEVMLISSQTDIMSSHVSCRPRATDH